ncbi:hypothetical protein PIB30_013803 [Stylosanthes scabra]|uniref:Uncharacterized protein n=1 Tax=Stylosanthes scabra TaxID=79078 RepID=A0ABU6R5J0_9FABA|nr:hypothetical protein [Stylosanthes scabra]
MPSGGDLHGRRTSNINGNHSHHYHCVQKSLHLVTDYQRHKGLRKLITWERVTGLGRGSSLGFYLSKIENVEEKVLPGLKVPRPLDAAEACLYGWVEEAVLTQPSVVESDSLPEFHRNFPLMEDSGVEGDYVMEATGLSDRVPFRAGEDGPHFLWVYQELFTRLRMRLPFSDFQRDIMTRCRSPSVNFI